MRLGAAFRESTGNERHRRTRMGEAGWNRLREALAAAGLSALRAERLALRPAPAVCVIGRR
jgi:hypothetical protein